MSDTIKFTTTAKLKVHQSRVLVTSEPVIFINDGKMFEIPAGTQLPVYEDILTTPTQEDTP